MRAADAHGKGLSMRTGLAVVVVLAGGLVAPLAQAAGQGFGNCKSGFADHTRVTTEARGEQSIRDVQVNDRVWSMNQDLGRPGWSKVLRRVDGGRHYMLLVDFSDPESNAVTKGCWRITREN
jgi:hypothetical protein